jgi:hypothetical protein
MNKRNSKLLGGITLALVLGDVVGIYAVQHKLTRPPEFAALNFESASEAVANAARHFRPDGMQSPVAVARYEFKTDLPAVIANTVQADVVHPKAIAALSTDIAPAPLVKAVSRPMVSTHGLASVSLSVQKPADKPVAQPVRRSASAFAAAFPATGTATKSRTSISRVAKSLPMPDFAAQNSAVSTPSATQVNLGAALSDAQAVAGVDADTAAIGASSAPVAVPVEASPAPSDVPAASDDTGELPAI